jgi:hypothetical protein
MSIPVSSPLLGPDANLSRVLDLLAQSEARCRDLERRQRRLYAGFALALTLGLSATFVGLSGAIAEESPQTRAAEPTAGSAPDLEARRQALLAKLPADQRQEIGDFAAKVQWLSEFMHASPDFDAGAAVALFLSMMVRDISAVPGMYQEMQVMNARMAAVPAMAAELQGINAKMSVMTSAMDSTMGRAGRMMPWMPFSP